jgi:hypothetical protein
LRRHLVQRQDVKTKPEDLSAISLLENKCEEIYRKYMPIRLRATTENYDISEYSYSLRTGGGSVSQYRDQITLVVLGFW